VENSTEETRAPVQRSTASWARIVMSTIEQEPNQVRLDLLEERVALKLCLLVCRGDNGQAKTSAHADAAAVDTNGTDARH
jgi:hypothetical protein